MQEALERGCSRPGCDVPACCCQVHHVTDCARGGPTNIDNLTLACGPDNVDVTENGWTTRKRQDGTTEWIPPPGHPEQPRTNTYFHPEKMLPEVGNVGSRQRFPGPPRPPHRRRTRIEVGIENVAKVI